ncbi:MAG TPA: hypothetical protein VGL37_05290 [Solirubrobacteraceae bacterium]|jgi:hypothetical protein
MSSGHLAQAESAKRVYVARDPHPASATVQKAVQRATRAADRETDAMKAKRPARRSGS